MRPNLTGMSRTMRKAPGTAASPPRSAASTPPPPPPPPLHHDPAGNNRAFRWSDEIPTPQKTPSMRSSEERSRSPGGSMARQATQQPFKSGKGTAKRKGWSDARSPAPRVIRAPVATDGTTPAEAHDSPSPGPHTTPSIQSAAHAAPWVPGAVPGEVARPTVDPLPDAPAPFLNVSPPPVTPAQAHRYNISLHPPDLSDHHVYLGVVCGRSSRALKIIDTFDVEWTSEVLDGDAGPALGEVVEFVRHRWGTLRAVNVRHCADPEICAEVQAFVVRHPFTVSSTLDVSEGGSVTTSSTSGVVTSPGRDRVPTGSSGATPKAWRAKLRDIDGQELLLDDSCIAWVGPPRALQRGDQVLVALSRNLPTGCNIKVMQYVEMVRGIGIITRIRRVKGRVSSTTYFVRDTQNNDWCFFSEHFWDRKSVLEVGIVVTFELPYSLLSDSELPRRSAKGFHFTVTKVRLAEAHVARHALRSIFPVQGEVVDVDGMKVKVTVKMDQGADGESGCDHFTVSVKHFMPSPAVAKFCNVSVGQRAALNFVPGKNKKEQRLLWATFTSHKDPYSTFLRPSSLSAETRSDASREGAAEAVAAAAEKRRGVIASFDEIAGHGTITAQPNGMQVYFSLASLAPETPLRAILPGATVYYYLSWMPSERRQGAVDVLLSSTEDSASSSACPTPSD